VVGLKVLLTPGVYTWRCCTCPPHKQGVVTCDGPGWRVKAKS